MSYTPVEKAPAVGIEPTTSGSGNRRASIAPRGPEIKPWSRWGSNPGPSPYRSDALPTELRDHVGRSGTCRACVARCRMLRQPTGAVASARPHGVAVALRIPNPTTAVRFRLRSQFELPENCRSPMAQSVARQAVNLQVAGSNPAGGAFFSSRGSAPEQLAEQWTPPGSVV